ncbi:hypothetical protein [Sorangium sp. So ce1182]|uniref:hypothetical protein n=1 Tax=Sorangium sp. So ce1182 TaxID=3133334 RepID=UPI003F635B22
MSLTMHRRIGIAAGLAVIACTGAMGCISGGDELGTTEQALCTPWVNSVSPLSVPADTWQPFFIQGGCLPDTLAFWIANCPDVRVEVDDSGDWAVARCWTGTVGYQEGVVKDRSGGRELESFTVEVYNTD